MIETLISLGLIIILLIPTYENLRRQCNKTRSNN